jgi:hypothetical protein
MVEGRCQQYDQTSGDLLTFSGRTTVLNGRYLSRELERQLDKLNMCCKGQRLGVFTDIHGVKSVCA